MDTKHTPGPWWLGERKGDYIEISGPKHSGLATAVWQMEDDRLCDENSPQCEANARLIAAGPELLEALILARKYVADLPIVGDADLTIVDAAIAKATQP